MLMVEHPKYPELGRGKVITVEHGKALVEFGSYGLCGRIELPHDELRYVFSSDPFAPPPAPVKPAPVKPRIIRPNGNCYGDKFTKHDFYFVILPVLAGVIYGAAYKSFWTGLIVGVIALFFAPMRRIW